MDELDEIRNHFPLLDYVQRHYDLGNMTVTGNGYLFKNCPICGSKSPKRGDKGHFGIGKDKSFFKCFSSACPGNNGGSIIDFLKLAENISLAEAIKKAKEEMGLDNSFVVTKTKAKKVVEKVEEKKEVKEIELMAEELEVIEKGLANRNVEKVVEVVEKRGIKAELVNKYNMFISTTAGYEKLYIPIKENDKFVGYVARALQEKDGIRYKNNKGEIVPFNRDYYKKEAEVPGEKIYICEGVFDMLSLESTGKKAISLNSVTNSPKLIEDIERHISTSASYEFILALDNDEAGINETKKIEEAFTKMKITYSKLNIPTRYKDVNEWYLAEPGEMLFAITENASNLDYLNCVFSKDIEKMTKYKSKSTGFKDLDKALNGIVPGLYVIGAISSLGKTTFVSQIADQMAIEGESVLFFSLEQSRFELVAKSISRETYKISPKEAKTSLNIMQANFSEATYNAVENYSSYADKIRVIEGNFDMDVFKIREIVEMFIQKTHIKPVVVIDYLQILKPINDKMTDKAQVDYNVSELKRISRDNDIPLFVICSFNRENYTSTVDFKSFKESGAIEYGADVVLGLQLSVINQLPNNVTEQRELINKAKSQKVREIDLICLKNRNGKSYFKCRYKYYSAFNVFIEDGLVE